MADLSQPLADFGQFGLLSFARHGCSKSQSFPRKRESTPQTFANPLSTDWIPAFAGMTSVS